jgi:hypothetical protein
MRIVTKKDGIQHTKANLGESLKKKLESKSLKGQYIKSADRQLIREGDTFLWLSWGGLKGEIKVK